MLSERLKFSARRIPENFPEIAINDITLIPLSFEHDLKTLDANRSTIYNAMREADYTIFEYFPNEIEQENPSYGLPPQRDRTGGRRSDGYHRFYWETIKPFFDETTKMAVKIENHKLLVMDPAHDLAFAYIHALFPFTSVGEAALASMLFKHNTKTRREFLVFLATGAIVFKTADWIQMSIERATGKVMVLNEATFRRAVIAEGIEILSQDKRYKNATINLLYPPTHIEGIIQMLDNPIRRKTEIYAHKADLLMLLPALRESLFFIRQYERVRDSDKWKKYIVGRI